MDSQNLHQAGPEGQAEPESHEDGCFLAMGGGGLCTCSQPEEKPLRSHVALPGASVAEVAILAFAWRLLDNPYLKNEDTPREVREFMVEYKELFADAPARELDEDFLSVRDEFAMAALPAYIAEYPYERAAAMAYKQADAMMQARKGGAR